MKKSVVKLEQKTGNEKKEYSLEQIRNALKENNACYVLITCTDPTSDGKMNVEMSYDGDEVLASYLVDNAQQVFDGRASNEKSH
ncbi:MAG: hypothetical protein HW387_353 [Parachlamydiales bacterium]|nr:hypothetical protein [Parachlamydiales bacterium]